MTGAEWAYRWCTAPTDIELDDDACAKVMRRDDLATKLEAVDFAPRPMVLVDPSAWVELPRDTGTSAWARADERLDDDLVTCHPVRMEVLAGARRERHLRHLRDPLARTLYAIRAHAPLLHADAEVDVLARQTRLAIDRP